MTNDTDTSAAVEQAIRYINSRSGEKRAEAIDTVRALASERDTLAVELAEVKAERDIGKQFHDLAVKERDLARRQLSNAERRAEAAEAKLAVARDALEDTTKALDECINGDDFGEVDARKVQVLIKSARNALALLDTDQPTPEVSQQWPVRPNGSNADEWSLYIDDLGVEGRTAPYLAVQIAEAIDEAKDQPAPRDGVTVGERLTPSQIDSACLSYDHSYGLMCAETQESMRRECEEWWRCISRTLAEGGE